MMMDRVDCRRWYAALVRRRGVRDPSASTPARSQAGRRASALSVRRRPQGTLLIVVVVE